MTNARALATDNRVVAVLAVGAGVVAAMGPARPVGFRAADVIWTGLFVTVVALASARSARPFLLLLAAIASLAGVTGDAAAVLTGLGALALALALVSTSQELPAVGALLGALAATSFTVGPSYGPAFVPLVVGAAAVVPVLASGYHRSSKRAQRMARRSAVGLAALVGLGCALSLLLAAMVLSDTRSGSDAARSALDQLRADDLEASAASFDDAGRRFSSVHDSLDGPLGVVGRVVPVVSQNLDAVRRVAAAGEELATAGAASARSADYEGVKTNDGSIDLSALAAMQAPVARSATAAKGALETLEDVRTPWLLSTLEERLDDLQIELEDVEPSTRQASDALQIAPGLLGAEGEKRYLIALATPAESRLGGGYVGSYAVLTANNGHLALSTADTTGDATRNLTTDAERLDFTPPPGWNERYASYDVDVFPGNITASPDWPTDTDVALQLFPQLPDVGPLDGAFYTDPAALAAILGFTGPVTLPEQGLELDATNIERFLLVGQYELFPDQEERYEVLDDVVRSVFDALVNRPLPGAGQLFDHLGPAVAAGHLRFSVTDPAAEELFDEVGLSGRWETTPGADYLSVRTYDLRSNKLDYFLERTIGVQTQFDAGSGQFYSEVTVELTNTAPPSGLPPYVTGADFGDSAPGTVRDGLALFTPSDLLRVQLDGSDVGVEQSTELGGNVFTVAVEVPPGTTRTVTYSLRGHLASDTYELDVVPQALASPSAVTVSVAPLGAPERATTIFEGALERQIQLRWVRP
jgi:hypothetical protein